MICTGKLEARLTVPDLGKKSSGDLLQENKIDVAKLSFEFFYFALEFLCNKYVCSHYHSSTGHHLVFLYFLWFLICLIL